MRDLAWACFSPALINMHAVQDPPPRVQAAQFDLTPTRQRWLAHLDAQPEALLAHLAAHQSRRLGLYFESLWHFFLQQDGETDLIAHNLPVHDNGITLGEFDCIYYCHRRRQHCHLELAVKYFLEVMDIPGQPTRYWVGPNSQDRLDLKVRHMLEQQLRLADQPCAQAILADLDIAELSRECLLRGYLFHRWLPDLARKTPAWLPLDKLAVFTASHQPHTYLTLPRLRWLSPAVSAESDPVLERADLINTVAETLGDSKRPVLVAALDRRGAESSRFFVTPTSWLAQAQSDLQA